MLSRMLSSCPAAFRKLKLFPSIGSGRVSGFWTTDVSSDHMVWSMVATQALVRIAVLIVAHVRLLLQWDIAYQVEGLINPPPVLGPAFPPPAYLLLLYFGFGFEGLMQPRLISICRSSFLSFLCARSASWKDRDPWSYPKLLLRSQEHG